MFRQTAFAATVVLGLAAGPAAAQDDERPNIIFIFSDDHAAQTIGAYQDALDYGLELEHSPTPNIDRLARQGMRFDNAFVTNSICKPSRAAVLTGQFGHLNGMRDNANPRFDNSNLTYTELLQDAGYQTAVIGKWHLGSEPENFDYYEVLRGQGPYYNPEMRTSNGSRQRHGHTTEIITDRTLHWLKQQRDRDKPFMLMYQHKAPHRNWVPGPKHLNDYRGRDLPEPDTLFYDYSGLASPAHNQDMEIATTMRRGWDLIVDQNPETGESGEQWNRLVNHNDLTDRQLQRIKDAYGPANEQLYSQWDQMSDKDKRRWRYQRYIKNYLRVIRGVDDGVGRVLDYLERTGLDDNTIVIYTSDQGFFVGENGWFDKRWMYEESFRTPFIVRWPDEVRPGSSNDGFVQNIDFGPTMLDMAGLDIPDRMQGKSLVPLMKGNTPDDWRDALYYQYFEYPAVHSVRRHYGIRTDRYKLIHYFREGKWELFDLQEDPEELESVYGDSDYAQVQKRLKQRLDKLQDNYEVPEKIVSPDAE